VRRGTGERRLQETAGVGMPPSGGFRLASQIDIPAAGPFEIRSALPDRALLQGGVENQFQSGIFHDQILRQTKRRFDARASRRSEIHRFLSNRGESAMIIAGAQPPPDVPPVTAPNVRPAK